VLYSEFIKTVQQYDNLSKDDAEDTLQVLIEQISVHLNEGERRNFASQLPERLEDIALTVLPTPENASRDIFEQVMELEDLEEATVKERLQAAWRALKDGLSEGLIDSIKAQLPQRTVSMLESK
jgi:uncharacterized protein (DUF2267 family)